MIDETFSVDKRQLVRHVVPKRGKPYEHRCSEASLIEVAHRIDEFDGAPFVLTDLNRSDSLPWTQVAVAVAFLKERGCIRPVRRWKHVSACGDLFLHAMTEFNA